jgi:hypothetical protein
MYGALRNRTERPIQKNFHSQSKIAVSQSPAMTSDSDFCKLISEFKTPNTRGNLRYLTQADVAVPIS